MDLAFMCVVLLHVLVRGRRPESYYGESEIYGPVPTTQTEGWLPPRNILQGFENDREPRYFDGLYFIPEDSELNKMWWFKKAEKGQYGIIRDSPQYQKHMQESEPRLKELVKQGNLRAAISLRNIIRQLREQEEIKKITTGMGGLSLIG